MIKEGKFSRRPSLHDRPASSIFDTVSEPEEGWPRYRVWVDLTSF